MAVNHFKRETVVYLLSRLNKYRLNGYEELTITRSVLWELSRGFESDYPAAAYQFVDDLLGTLIDELDEQADREGDS